MAKIQDIINILETMFPPHLAESWDKVGLQVGNPKTPVKKIFLTLDVTETAVKEAIQQKTNLIISHHPFIFDPIKSLVDSEVHTHIISLLLKNKISVYVAHTNLDFSPGGTCHSLAEELKLQNIGGLSPVYEQKHKKIAVFVPSSHLEKVSQAMFSAGAGIIGDYSSCSYRIDGTGTFKGSESSKPFFGKAGQLETVKETRLEMLVPANKVQDVLKAMRSAHPYEEVAFDIYPLENPHPQASKGVIGTLSKIEKLDSWAKEVKSLLRLKGLRVIGKPEQKIRTVAIVTGSGSDFITDAVREKCDALVTGDMKYHQALHALDLGLAVLDVGHYPSEERYMPVLAKRLNKTFKSLNWQIPIVVSKTGSDPFRFF
jgi:dinuclear metal center YbgI/SA1388 family protein